MARLDRARIRTAAQYLEELEACRSEADAAAMQRYFKTGKGEYGEGDVFMGVRMGDVFRFARQSLEMPLSEIETLLESPFHEARAGAVSIMTEQYGRRKASEAERQALFDLYFRRHDRINNWDLVDKGTVWLVAPHMAGRSFDLLRRLSQSDNLWERRSAIMGTMTCARRGERLDEVYEIVGLLLGDREDLIHKATGWILRVAGDRDRPRLLAFLDTHAPTMPRTALRYAMEHLEKPVRVHYLKLGK